MSQNIPVTILALCKTASSQNTIRRTEESYGTHPVAEGECVLGVVPMAWKPESEKERSAPGRSAVSMVTSQVTQRSQKVALKSHKAGRPESLGEGQRR